MPEIRSIQSMADQLAHGFRPPDADLPTELSKTLACFDKFPDGSVSYDLTIPVYGDRPTFSAIEYADGKVGGTLTLYKPGDEHQTMAVGVTTHNPNKPLGLPVTMYGDSLAIAPELRALKFGAFFMTFCDGIPGAVIGITPDGECNVLPDIGCSVFPGERLSQNHYFYYVMRYILGKVSGAKPGLHISPEGIVSRLPVMQEPTK